ncbi:unnamed protein product [Gordionus sp. m RMFG-2023]|uniref:pre-mRNA 3' end processing protein WDR33-like n=1 Tax=Gordionus sp. m RMFG-2023 TaxID=3053472 RepID=UPI0030E5B550
MPPQLSAQHYTPNQALNFDGKRMRKSVNRKTVDYNSSIIKYLEERKWRRDSRDINFPEPDPSYNVEMLPPEGYSNNPINSVMTKFIRTATNKIKCPIFSVVWTPDGRRLITGASSGEFTLWNGLTFNFETILQAHDTSVRAMVWSHSDQWMVTADHGGYIKYWQSNMNNVKMYQAHKEAIRGLTFSPTDHKLASCADDGTVRIWDFERCAEEKILRGHGSDVKCIDWHPCKSLLASGSKDNQQPVKLWDPKSGQSLATIHSHKGTVMSLGWNPFNSNWLVTGSRDHSLKLFDIRNFKEEVQTFRGHKKDITSLSWHPIHENLFVSGSADGTILYWTVGNDKDVGGIEQAHDSIIWTLSWHPLGHILVSGSNDHTTKFWTRNRPGDLMHDKDNTLLSSNSIGVEDYISPRKLQNDYTKIESYSTSKNTQILNTATPLLDANQAVVNSQVSLDDHKTPSTQSCIFIPGLDIIAPTNSTHQQPSDTIRNIIDRHEFNALDREDSRTLETERGSKYHDTDNRYPQDNAPYNKSHNFDSNSHNYNEQNYGKNNFPTNFNAPNIAGTVGNILYQRVQDDFHVRNAPSFPNNFSDLKVYTQPISDENDANNNVFTNRMFMMQRQMRAGGMMMNNNMNSGSSSISQQFSHDPYHFNPNQTNFTRNYNNNDFTQGTNNNMMLGGGNMNNMHKFAIFNRFTYPRLDMPNNGPLNTKKDFRYQRNYKRL